MMIMSVMRGGVVPGDIAITQTFEILVSVRVDLGGVLAHLNPTTNVVTDFLRACNVFNIDRIPLQSMQRSREPKQTFFISARHFMVP